MDELQLLKTIFEHMTNTPIGEKITVFMVAWFFVRRTIKAEFKTIDTTIKMLNDTIVKLETAHALRITLLDTALKALNDTISTHARRIEDLEKQLQTLGGSNERSVQT